MEIFDNSLFGRFITALALFMISSSSVSAQTLNKQSEMADKPIQLIERVPPTYPTLALYKKIEGWAKVSFTITAEGEIVDLHILDSSPQGVFDQAAMDAVSKFKISPAIKDGQYIAQQATQTIEFELPDKYLVDQDSHTLKKMLNGRSFAEYIESVDSKDKPKDAFMILKSVDVKSKIKPHKRSVQVKALEIKPNKEGIPSEVVELAGNFAEGMPEQKVSQFKQTILEQAKSTHQAFQGYYNPYYMMVTAKNYPVTAYSPIEAKSMPVPEYSHDIEFKTRLVISEKGKIIEVVEAVFDDIPITDEMARQLLRFVVFSEAQNKYKPVEDEIDVMLVFSIVQVHDVAAIKKQWLESL